MCESVASDQGAGALAETAANAVLAQLWPLMENSGIANQLSQTAVKNLKCKIALLGTSDRSGIQE